MFTDVSSQTRFNCRRGPAPPDLPEVFSPERKAGLILAAVVCCLPGLALSDPLVFSATDEQISLDVEQSVPTAINGRAWVAYRLVADAANVMAEFTDRMIGEEVQVSLCGYDLMRATPRARIEGSGRISVESMDLATAIADVLLDNAECGALSPYFTD